MSNDKNPLEYQDKTTQKGFYEQKHRNSFAHGQTVFRRIFRTSLSCKLSIYSMEASITKESKKESYVIRRLSSNGEVHLIFEDSQFDENTNEVVDLDQAEIQIIMKKEASRPLLILRKE